jgi:hypothetical protein
MWYPLILRSAKRVSKDEAPTSASWFETAQVRLLTMRVYSEINRRTE